MQEFTKQTIICPHCGFHTQVELDASNGDQDYYEDCRACCCSIHLRLIRDELHDKLQLYVDASDEQVF